MICAHANLCLDILIREKTLRVKGHFFSITFMIFMAELWRSSASLQISKWRETNSWTMVDHVGHEIRDDPRYPRRSPPTSKRSMEVGADPGVTFLKAAHFSMTHIGPYISLDNIIIYHNIPMYPKIADPISENHRGSA